MGPILIYVIPVVLAWLGYRQLAGTGPGQTAVKLARTLLRRGLHFLWRDRADRGSAGRLDHPQYRYRDPGGGPG